MSDTTYISLRNYYERTVQIEDADGNVVDLPIRVRRFTLEQLQTFSAARKRAQDYPAERLIYRKPDGDEQAKEPMTYQGATVMVPAVPDVEIRRRRLAEMTDEQREAFEREEEAVEARIAAFHRDAITEHVWVKPGVRLVVEDESGETRDVRSGADLLAVFGGNVTTLKALSDAVFEENTLSAEAKKKSRSLSASMSSSPASPPTAAGAAPAGTAAAAEPKGSAVSAGVTDVPGPSPSGSTGT